MSQLQCAGMTSVLELMQQGFPSRTPFSELYSMYKLFLPAELARLDPRLFCKSLFKALGLDDRDFKFGLTKAFFRPGKFAEFDQMLKSDPENLRILIAKVRKWLLCSRWKKCQWCALSVIKLKNKIIYRHSALIMIQKTTRMYLAQKYHKPRYEGIRRLKLLQSNIEQIGKMSESLTAEKAGVMINVNKINSQLDQAIARIRASPRIPVSEIDKMYNNLIGQIDTELITVKRKLEKQRIEEEQERMRKLQQEMELERKRKEEEEKRKRELETEKQKKVEIEVRRKGEEDLLRKMEEDRLAAESRQEQLNAENQRLREQLEQVKTILHYKLKTQS